MAIFTFGYYSLNKTDLQKYISNSSVKESENTQKLYAVEYVIDGDTIVLNIDGEKTTVRFIGIDTPESVNSDESKNTEEGKIASEFTKNLLNNKRVYLEYDVGSTDKYGRTLAYVFLEDGTFVNDYLVSEGYAYVMTVQPNVKYQNVFLESFETAQKEHKGLWKE